MKKITLRENRTANALNATSVIYLASVGQQFVVLEWFHFGDELVRRPAGRAMTIAQIVRDDLA